MQNEDFVNGLIDFIKSSPTPFHAVEVMAQILERHGFKQLDESDQWAIDSAGQGERFYVTRNDSSIIAFQLNQSLLESGMRMVGAHTDSPCLKVKPNPEIINNNYLQLGVEVYGGALLNPWFDRDLSLAGRVSYLTESGAIDHQLIDLEKAIAVIPSLAIHLDREANDKRTVDKQKHLPPILMKLPESDADTRADFKAMLLKIINANGTSTKAEKVLSYELSFYDTQPPAVIGLHDDFIASARLDNLL
ncbi:MAG: M18 family aminopeptidase, partial [Proteobacteria bacterium]|nr:M18 family aminopeptidase [Pseudomonadota bacterium]